MEPLSKKYSLDWLVTGSAPSIGEQHVAPAAARRPSPLDEAIIYFSEPIRETLKEQGGKMRMHDLVERVNAKRQVKEFEQFVGVVNYLHELGFVTYMDNDLRGNRLVRLLK